MKKTVIIHFNPLELYPPVMNLLNILPNDNQKIKVFTTSGVKLPMDKFSVNNGNVTIYRIGYSGKSMKSISRFFNYVSFHLFLLGYLVFFRPQTVFYYETLSSFPALFYKKFINRASRLYIHYHEYSSLLEYKSSSRLLQFFYLFERKMYSSAKWISHICSIRLQQFELDNPQNEKKNTRVLSNYPPLNWSVNAPKSILGNPLRIVYVGSMGMDLMYTEFFARWVKQMEGFVEWDIYAVNNNPAVMAFFKEISAKNIHWKGYTDYRQLPAVLKEYDVGLVLYKGEIPNHLYVTPNKLFEYHVCGLDVWLPDKLIACLPYVTQATYPKVCALDFENLQDLDLQKLIDRTGCTFSHQQYSCELELKQLINELCK